MTTVEKVIIGIIVICFIVIGKSCYEIEQAGGLKTVIIETGKEIKEIRKEINKD